MSLTKSEVLVFISVFVLAVAASSCSATPEEAGEELAVSASELTAQQRLNACRQDPRVVTGLASAEICAGAGIFFEETFGGNGRTCGSCHPAANNLTIDPAFIATRPQSDPLFVFENNPALAGLETESLREGAGILENVNGFEDPTRKFVVRSVPHLLSLAISTTSDPADPKTTTPPLQRTGWGGDGGSLRNFVNTAIEQHFTRRLNRVPNVDFRLATTQEQDFVERFQLALGRRNELDFSQVNPFDAQAQVGKAAFLDPMRGRCNVCHQNGGANFIDTGKNRNFDTGTKNAIRFTIPFFGDRFLFDGGFGGQGLTSPNVPVIVFIDANGNILPNGFGNNTFSPPPIIEAVDTLPAFHSNFFGRNQEGIESDNDNIEDVVTFYAGLFQGSPAAAELNARFGGAANIGAEINTIGRFLRVLNVALNIDMAKQRLRASQTILNRFRDQHRTIQRRLIELAVAEIDDALEVLQDPRTTQPFYPVAVDRLNLCKQEIATALAGATWVQRQGPLSNAISRTENARDQIGANINFTLGAGNLFF